MGLSGQCLCITVEMINACVLFHKDHFLCRIILSRNSKSLGTYCKEESTNPYLDLQQFDKPVKVRAPLTTASNTRLRLLNRLTLNKTAEQTY